MSIEAAGARNHTTADKLVGGEFLLHNFPQLVSCGNFPEVVTIFLQYILHGLYRFYYFGKTCMTTRVVVGESLSCGKQWNLGGIKGGFPPRKWDWINKFHDQYRYHEETPNNDPRCGASSALNNNYHSTMNTNIRLLTSGMGSLSEVTKIRPSRFHSYRWMDG